MDIRLPFPEKSLSERIEAVKETAVHSGFPLRGEYSVKVAKSAQKNGDSVEVFTEKISRGFKKLFNDLEVNYDYFVRTSDKDHHWNGAKELWLKLVQSGDIYKKN